MIEPRLNFLILVIGKPGTGKTTVTMEIAKQLQDETGRKIIVVDTDFHPSYSNIKQVPLHKLKTWNGSICKIVESDIDLVCDRLRKYQRNAFIMFEDASKYVEPNLTNSQKRFVIDYRKCNFDVAFMFHYLGDVPPRLCKMYNQVLLFKTEDDLTVKQPKFSNWHIISKVAQSVKQHPNFNYCEAIEM
jgi:energy-coupling factor transporter ATP-binding protein EcfA2